MEWHEALILLIGCMLLLMAIGLPVALAFFGVNIVGAYLFLGGETGLFQLTRNSLASLASFTLAPIPLFLLMGEILFHSGIAFRAIDAVDKLILRIPGRLSIVTILGGTLFSSLSGYDIREAPKLWARMKSTNKGKQQPEFMSTHPSPDNRIKKLNEWMNEVTLKYPPIKQA